jgi:hypothetical protein
MYGRRRRIRHSGIESWHARTLCPPCSSCHDADQALPAWWTSCGSGRVTRGEASTAGNKPDASSCAEIDTVGSSGIWLCAAWIPLKRLAKCAVILKPSSFMPFHQALVRCKYRWLYASRKRGGPGPKGPTKEVIVVVVHPHRPRPAQHARQHRHTLLGESVWCRPPRRLLRSQSVTSKIPNCTQPCASRFEFRRSLRDKLPELRRVVHTLQMHQLVDHHVVAD